MGGTVSLRVTRNDAMTFDVLSLHLDSTLPKEVV